MKIGEERISDKVVLKLTGRLDASAASTVKDAVNDLTKKNEVFLVVDMQGVDFIDSTGLGTLVACLRSVNKHGGDIRIASLQDQVRAILELTRLHHIFGIYNDSAAAVESFQKQGNP